MGKLLDGDEVSKNKRQAIYKTNQLLEDLILKGDQTNLKKANLISYWIKEYSGYVSWEDNFDPKRNIRYKRGSIIFVNLGFKISKEYGGKHFCVVLDIKNEKASDVITVVPLTSNEKNKDNKNNVFLGSEMYSKINDKYNKLINEFKKEYLKLEEEIDFIKKLNVTAKDSIKTLNDEVNILTEEIGTKKEVQEERVQKLLNAIEQKIDEQKKIENRINILEEKIKINSDKRELLNKYKREIEHMKKGSVAIINQITTVSKLRIIHPNKTKDLFYNIGFSETTMRKINDKIQELYTL